MTQPENPPAFPFRAILAASMRRLSRDARTLGMGNAAVRLEDDAKSLLAERAKDGAK